MKLKGGLLETGGVIFFLDLITLLVLSEKEKPCQTSNIQKTKPRTQDLQANQHAPKLQTNHHAPAKRHKEEEKEDDQLN